MTTSGLHTANRVTEHLLQRTTDLCCLERQEHTSGKVRYNSRCTTFVQSHLKDQSWQYITGAVGFSVDKFLLYHKPLSHPYFTTSYITSAIYQYRNRASDTFMLFFFCYVIFFEGIVRMDPLDNLAFSSEYSRETGDIDQFQPKLIPLQINSYLGQCLIRSKSVWAAKLCFSCLRDTKLPIWRCFSVAGMLFYVM